MPDEDYAYARFEPKKASDIRRDESEDAEKPAFFDIGDETFVLLPRELIPSGAYRRLGGANWTVENGCRFIELVLEDKDDPKDETDTQIERFRATLERKDVVVDKELIVQIVRWVIGAVGLRPTSSPSGSTGGQKSTRNGSKAKRSGKESTSVG